MNPHHQYAISAFESANAKAEPEFNEAVRADALIQATLALAYEQRTANLIALLQWMGQRGASSKSIASELDERLGLS